CEACLSHVFLQRLSMFLACSNHARRDQFALPFSCVTSKGLTSTIPIINSAISTGTSDTAGAGRVNASATSFSLGSSATSLAKAWRSSARTITSGTGSAGAGERTAEVALFFVRVCEAATGFRGDCIVGTELAVLREATDMPG